jgi:hypothetical protein
MNFAETSPLGPWQTPRPEHSASADRWNPISRFIRWPMQRKQRPSHHRIEIKLRDLNQLFNTMDPSPFHEKDLDHDAEEFIVSWAQEFHRRDPVTLVIHLGEDASHSEAQSVAEQAVHHYFAYKAKLNRLEFKRIMKQARASLVIGLAFLGACFAASEAMTQLAGGFASVAREGFIIAGWVAMWRPMEMFLYDWWPLRRLGRIFEKLSRVPVKVHFPSSTR